MYCTLSTDSDHVYPTLRFTVCYPTSPPPWRLGVKEFPRNRRFLSTHYSSNTHSPTHGIHRTVGLHVSLVFRRLGSHHFPWQNTSRASMCYTRVGAASLMAHRRARPSGRSLSILGRSTFAPFLWVVALRDHRSGYLAFVVRSARDRVLRTHTLPLHHAAGGA